MERKYKEGVDENNESKKSMYEYLVQVELIADSKEFFEDPKHLKCESGDIISKIISGGNKRRKKGERGIIVLKLEPKKETGKEKVLNYGITPKDCSLADPLQQVNNRIAKITIIAKINL